VATASEAIDASISEVVKARAFISKVKSKQIRNVDAVAAMKSTAHAWFNSHRPVIASAASNVTLTDVDFHYTTILDATTRHASRQTYLDALKLAKEALIKARSGVLLAPSDYPLEKTDDRPPDFSSLVGNEEMQKIIARRWDECRRCVAAQAHLAAIVMMGGLLEALFIARANKMTDKKALVSAKSAPKDKTTGKTLNYQDWMLDSYIKVAHELNWITGSARDVADVLKEYRNYVHPEKERRHGVTLAFNDSSMFWQVTKELVRQLLISAASA
jgi:hypothetical protein